MSTRNNEIPPFPFLVGRSTQKNWRNWICFILLSLEGRQTESQSVNEQIGQLTNNPLPVARPLSSLEIRDAGKAHCPQFPSHDLAPSDEQLERIKHSKSTSLACKDSRWSQSLFDLPLQTYSLDGALQFTQRTSVGAVVVADPCLAAMKWEKGHATHCCSTPPFEAAKEGSDINPRGFLPVLPASSFSPFKRTSGETATSCGNTL